MSEGTETRAVQMGAVSAALLVIAAVLGGIAIWTYHRAPSQRWWVLIYAMSLVLAGAWIVFKTAVAEMRDARKRGSS